MVSKVIEKSGTALPRVSASQPGSRSWIWHSLLLCMRHTSLQMWYGRGQDTQKTLIQLEDTTVNERLTGSAFCSRV